MKALIIAGPNGAGKTTFAKSFLPQEAHVLRFINADLIAAGLSPFAPEQMAVKAGRLMLQEVKEAVTKRESFAIETTLSGSAYLKHIREWQTLSYEVSLFFLQLSSVELAISRVAQRVKQGGHHIPEAVIRRRHQAGLDNFPIYAELVNDWSLFNNDDSIPIKLASGGRNVSNAN
jgi:predicted ABC-type ATPase